MEQCSTIEKELKYCEHVNRIIALCIDALEVIRQWTLSHIPFLRILEYKSCGQLNIHLEGDYNTIQTICKLKQGKLERTVFGSQKPKAEYFRS